MSWLSGKPIASYLGGARFESSLALLVYIYVYTYLIWSPDVDCRFACAADVGAPPRRLPMRYHHLAVSPVRFWLAKTSTSG